MGVAGTEEGAVSAADVNRAAMDWALEAAPEEMRRRWAVACDSGALVDKARGAQEVLAVGAYAERRETGWFALRFVQLYKEKEGT